MSIGSAAVLLGSTTFVAPTGGTSADMSIIDRVGKKILAYFDSESDFTTRKTIEFSTKDPQVLATAPGGYTQAREKVYVKWPITLTNGNRTVCTCSIEISRDPELSAADFVDLRLLACQLLADSDFDRFWINHEMG